MEDRWGMPANSAEDRLSALRPTRTTDQPPKRPSQRGWKIGLTREVVLGVILLLVGAVVAVMMVGGDTPLSTTGEAAVATAPGQTDVPALTHGQAYFAALVQPGAYPPGLTNGDSVVIVVTPQSSSEGTTRMLQDVVRVVDVESSDGPNPGVVVTLLGPEMAVRDIADSGSVHLAIVNHGE